MIVFSARQYFFLYTSCRPATKYAWSHAHLGRHNDVSYCLPEASLSYAQCVLLPSSTLVLSLGVFLHDTPPPGSTSKRTTWQYKLRMLLSRRSARIALPARRLFHGEGVGTGTGTGTVVLFLSCLMDCLYLVLRIYL
jgi:hypothetical protein